MKYIKKVLYKYIKGFPKPLKYIWSSSLTIVLIQELWLFSVPEIFPYAAELGLVFEKILLSLIASIILYYFTTFFPKIQKKESVSIIINNSLFKINNLSISLIYTLYNHVGIEHPANLNLVTKEDLLRIISRENMRNRIIFTFDGIEYSDTLYMLSSVKMYFEQFYNLIIPYIDLVDKETMKEMNYIINQICIIHDPVQLLKERTMISPGIYADIIMKMFISGGKLKN